jgi:hypothetical protein
MGILGLTHDENGAALEKLPVTIKVAIGEGPPMSRRVGADRQRQCSTVCNAGNTEDIGAPPGRTVARHSQICGWADEGAANRGLW